MGVAGTSLRSILLSTINLKTSEIVEDARIKNETKIKVTTKTLVNGKWHTTVKFIPREK